MADGLLKLTRAEVTKYGWEIRVESGRQGREYTHG